VDELSMTREERERERERERASEIIGMRENPRLL
jgi:hypothetical protein